MKKPFRSSTLSAHEAITEAQRIAFAPMVFQAARSLRELGVLTALDDAGKSGVSMETLAANCQLSKYGLTVLVECGLSAGIIDMPEEDCLVLGKIGYFLLHDRMTRVNMDFNHAVCYLGMYRLEEAIKEGAPAGLKEIDQHHSTIYEALPHLPESIKNSWYAFDHFYSDAAYPAALKIVLEENPSTLVDIGANQGRFSILAANTDANLQMTMVDLPDQLANAESLVAAAGLSGHIDGIGMDIRDKGHELPAGRDAYWLSQFVCCFSEDEIVSILSRIASAMTQDSTLYILETCWDRQKEEAAAFSLVNTSPYFTCLANGNSRMYTSDDLLKCINNAGLNCSQITDGLGNYHTLFACRKLTDS